jgi:hypothetical protein
VIPGNWEVVGGLDPGTSLVVTLKSGSRLEGAFKSIAPDMLALTDPAARELKIPLSTIASVVGPRSSDRLTNGVVIGTSIGLGVAIAVLAALGSQDGYVLPSAKVGAPLLLSGAGALLGALVDRAHKGRQVLYVAD